ncbi:MAG TPA: NAD(P)H-dependent oxidoreductase [Terriglobales bacterium]|nr:NAD(P)H-dependent oxidoreductase [Terriglobales bacterium]
MATLLYITVSPRGNHSISRQLGNAAVEAWKKKNPTGRVIERDLSKTALTFVDLDWISGAFAPPEYHTENHKKALAISDELVSELVEADEIILATPMFNFAIPASLKAWIDHVVRAGKTFRYNAEGRPEGLLASKNKKVLAIIASGGAYSERSGMTALDHQSPYLRFILGFMGITDVRFVQAGGTGEVMQGRKSPDDFLAPHLKEVAAAI